VWQGKAVEEGLEDLEVPLAGRSFRGGLRAFGGSPGREKL
jgi:hypothetical protein